MHVERINRFFRCKTNAALAIYSWYARIRRSPWVPNKDYTGDDYQNDVLSIQKVPYLSRLVESSHCRGREWSIFCWFSLFFRRSDIQQLHRFIILLNIYESIFKDPQIFYSTKRCLRFEQLIKHLENEDYKTVEYITPQTNCDYMPTANWQ